MVDAPEKIWIGHDDCPYFYEESELAEVDSPVTEYVRADLYAALEVENKRLKENAISWSMEASRYAKALDKAREREAEVLSTGVKPLEWEETHTRRSEEDPTTEWNGGFEADSALGYYKINMGFGSDAYYWAVTNPLGDDVGSAFEDPSYAKAAAQADYERRILSALEPAKQAERSALAEALKALTNLVQEIDDLVSESEGVAGLHLNGDVAEWCDLLPGGPYERLTSLDDARRARNITIEMIKLALASDWRASFVKIEG